MPRLLALLVPLVGLLAAVSALALEGAADRDATHACCRTGIDEATVATLAARGESPETDDDCCPTDCDTCPLPCCSHGIPVVVSLSTGFSGPASSGDTPGSTTTPLRRADPRAIDHPPRA